MRRAYLFGQTVNGLAITAHCFVSEAGNPEVLILGGVHGDEPEGVVAGLGLLYSLEQDNPYKLNITLVPALNWDGVLQGQRLNANAVDLNRNLPSKDWDPVAHKDRYQPGPNPGSEPENQALIRYLKEKKPRLIISLHSWKPMLNVNGDCKKEAKAIGEINGYSIVETIEDHPAPGCLGTYAGLEREMPTITYEIENGMKPKQVVEKHVPALRAGLKTAEVEKGR